MSRLIVNINKPIINFSSQLTYVIPTVFSAGRTAYLALPYREILS